MLLSLPVFSHFPGYPQANWAFLVLIPGWACARSRPLWVSPRNSPMRLGVSPTAASTSRGVFNQRFEALFPCAGALCCTVCCWVLQLLLACPSPQSATSLGPPATALRGVFSARLPISAPPTGLDECVFFNSLVVRLPYSLIFCQFWLFFVFKLLLSFFWLCKEAQYVSLRLHLGWKSSKNPKPFSKTVVPFYIFSSRK